MNCPECQGELLLIGYKGLAMNECALCQGRWIDREELARIRIMKRDDLKWLDFDVMARITAPGEGVEGKKCPRCSAAMTAMRYVDSNATVGRCGGCQGIWISPGEFTEILRQASKWVTKNIPMRQIAVIAGLFMVIIVVMMMWFGKMYKESQADLQEELLNAPPPIDFHPDRNLRRR